MTIKKPIPITFNLDSRQSVQSVCAVIHIDDKNTETLDLSLMQGGEHIAVSPNSTVTARFVRVKDKILISDNVPCAVQENGNILIPIDNAAAHMLVGEIKIEVNIVDENDILTMQFPLVIKVNNTILDDAEISPESEGTIPELLEEAREAAESATQAAEAATEAISTKQDKLTAGDNITISEENVISASSGSNDYTELENKPSINNVTLSGNKSSDDLSLQGKLTAGNNITIEGNVISAEGGGVTSYEALENKPKFQTKGLEVPFDLSGVNTSEDLETLIDAYGNRVWMVNFDIASRIPNYSIRFEQMEFPNRLPWVTEPIGDTVFINEIADSNSDLSNKIFSATSIYPTLGISARGDMFIANITDPNISIQLFTWSDLQGVSHIGYRLKTSRTEWSDLIEIGSGGSQIVSGVVNVNGTITFTDSEGDSFTTSGESVIGADGFSPSATVQQTASGATITVTDKNGTTTANITNGADGQDYVLTAQDKSDIADIVLSELPTTQGVLYGNTSN